MKKTNNYNPKLDYLFCKYASSRKPILQVDEEEWREVYRGSKKPSDPRQEKMLRLKAVLAFIKDDRCEFSASTLVGCLSIYLNGLPGDDVDYRALKRVFPPNKSAEIMDFRDLFIAIVKEKPFSAHINVEMAEIAANFLLIKRGKAPVVFYPSIAERLVDLISEEEIEGAKLLMLNLLQRSEALNRRHELIPLSALLERIEEIKPVLQSAYGVTSLSYYGSYAKNAANEWSDFDVFVEVDQEKRDDEDNKFLIKGFLERKLGIPVDCHVRDSGYGKNPLRVDMIRHLKTIF